jgi:hypothetical protein
LQTYLYTAISTQPKPHIFSLGFLCHAIPVAISTMRTPVDPQNPNRKAIRRGIGGTRNRYHPPTERTVFLTDSISIWGWPSRGGLIVLEHATALDFDFLGLDHVNPPLRRYPNQDAEDKLCQRLLLLGTKWFDSRDRYGFVSNVADDNEPEILALEAGEAQVRPQWRGDGSAWVIQAG